MYGGAQRALIGNTTMHRRSDARSAQKCDINDCQHRRKRLCRRCFRNSRIQRSRLDRRHDDSSMPHQSVPRGL
jgi:hypothetical protein